MKKLDPQYPTVTEEQAAALAKSKKTLEETG